MPPPSSRLLSTAGVAFFLLWASIARGEWHNSFIRLSGSVDRHSGAQSIPPIDFGGTTPNDVRLSGSYFGSHWLGFSASVREVGMSVSSGGSEAKSTLLTAQIGPSARYSRGPLLLYASVGYEWGRRVAFSDRLPAALSPLKVHALWLAAAARWEARSWLHPELRLEWPITVRASSGAAGARASSVTGALALLFPLGRSAAFAWSALLEGSYTRESATLAANSSLSASVTRAGAGLEWAFLPPPPPPPPPPAPEVKPPPPPPPVGDLDVAVVDKKNGHPVPYANLFVAGRDARTSQQGSVLLQGIRPGKATVDVEADGYLPGHEEVDIVQGALASVTVSLTRVERVGYATLGGIVRSARRGEPVAATVQILPGPRTIKVAADGVFFVQLQPGRYRVVISAEGYSPQSKSLILKEGDEAIYNVDLHPARSKK